MKPEFSRRQILRAGAVISAGNLLFHSPLLDAEALSTAAGDAPSMAGPQIDLAPRERLLFDFGWRFTHGHADDPARDLGYGEGFENGFSKSGAFDFAQPGYDDSKWRALDLPHDWGVELPFVNDDALVMYGFKPLGRRYPDTSIGWYRRTFDVPFSDEGRRISIEFDGAYRSTLVFCNGTFVGRSESGYTPFRFDLTDFLNYGGKNALAIRVDASLAEGWFYEGAGIYRHVWLSKNDALHLAPWETVVRAEPKGDSATLSLTTLVENNSEADQACELEWRIIDGAQKTVAVAHSPMAKVPAGAAQAFSATATLANPVLWSQQEPRLYCAIATVHAQGKACDRERIAFGVRRLAWDPDQGLSLNGRKTVIQGTCNHQDHAGVGAAIPNSLQTYRLRILKDAGCNAIRTSHNFPTPELIEACDRMGILVLCETRTMSSSDEALAQLETLIKRYRNHPSIFAWSVGNEEWFMRGAKDNDDWHTHADEAGRVVRSMQARAHRLDPTRLCTAAVNGYYNTDLADSLDIVGFNYNYQRTDDYRKAHPRRQLLGTEAGAEIYTRGIYSTDKLRNWVSSYSELRPDTSLDQPCMWWPFYARRPWVSGGFMWTGFDYRGEPSPYAWPSISSQFGMVDTCGFPKDSYFYYRAAWSNEPVLHLFPHWNWAGREGEDIRAQVHTNLHEVELFLNGRSLGSRKADPLYPLEWKVRYEPGVLEARGSKGGKVIHVTKRETTCDPARIVLTADRAEIVADGQDVAVVRVETIDNKGRSVPTADNLVRFKVGGAGTLIGVGNGDPNCHESDKGDRRSLFNGLAQAIVQASRYSGTITVEAACDGLQGATLAIVTRPMPVRPCVP